MKNLYLLTITLLLFALLLVGCNQSTVDEGVTPTTDVNAICLQSQSRCQVDTDIGQFQVRFSQQSSDKNSNKETEQHVITELPFIIEVSFSPIGERTLGQVNAHLEGKDMFMGKIPVFFKPATSTSDPTLNNKRVFIGESLLASCSAEIMTWRLWLNVQAGEHKQDFFIDFDSVRL